jgi:hypothetical protein
MAEKSEKENVRRICFDRVVPESYAPARSMAQRAAVSRYAATLQAKAGLTAKDVSPRASFGQNVAKVENLGELDANHPITVARMAIIALKQWDIGHTLRCRFLDGDEVQRQKVMENARKWEQYANLQLDFGDDPDAEIRISFQADSGSWSAIGADCLITDYFPKYQPTMNFGWLRDDTDDQECERVVVHEFGHALGCIHEHQQPNEHLKWDVNAGTRYSRLRRTIGARMTLTTTSWKSIRRTGSAQRVSTKSRSCCISSTARSFWTARRRR